jgi:hypothetical protein
MIRKCFVPNVVGSGTGKNMYSKEVSGSVMFATVYSYRVRRTVDEGFSLSAADRDQYHTPLKAKSLLAARFRS